MVDVIMTDWGAHIGVLGWDIWESKPPIITAFTIYVRFEVGDHITTLFILCEISYSCEFFSKKLAHWIRQFLFVLIPDFYTWLN